MNRSLRIVFFGLFLSICLLPAAHAQTLDPADIPQGISPNGDGLNEYWVIDALDSIAENEVFIFNRWGKVVYRQAPYLNRWDGHADNGEALPEGTYYYEVRINGETEGVRGYVVIKR